MSKDTIVIRKIRREDNAEIERIIKACFHEFKIPLVGTAYEDEATSNMYEDYQDNHAVYFVIEANGVVLGGGGIKPLPGYETTVCEIQKMYFSPKIRGKGYGKKLLKQCMASAKMLGYKEAYLESASQLKAAIHIYETFGFTHLKSALGNTGHYSCGVWMIKKL